MRQDAAIGAHHLRVVRDEQPGPQLPLACLAAAVAVSVKFQQGDIQFLERVLDGFDPSTALTASPVRKVDGSVDAGLIDQPPDVMHAIGHRSQKGVDEHLAGQAAVLDVHSSVQTRLWINRALPGSARAGP